MTASALEIAVIRRMLEDPELSPTRRSIEPVLLLVTERNQSEVGFITSFVRSHATKLFRDEVSARWGKVMGRLNASVDVDFVVYVDNGFVTAVEGATFGGEPWPAELLSFDLTDLPGR